MEYGTLENSLLLKKIIFNIRFLFYMNNVNKNQKVYLGLFLKFIFL